MLPTLFAAALALAASPLDAPLDGSRRALPAGDDVPVVAPAVAPSGQVIRLEGSLGPVTALRRADGARHAAAVLRRDGAAPLLIDLGPADRARALALRPGQRVIVRGRPGHLSGQPVLLAEAVERAGAASHVRPADGLATGLLGGPRVDEPGSRTGPGTEHGARGRPAPSSTEHVACTGELERIEEVTVGGRRLARVHLRGRVLLLDAPRWVLEALRPRQGDLVGVAGHLVPLAGRPVIVTDRVWIVGGAALAVPRRPRAVDAAVTARTR